MFVMRTDVTRACHLSRPTAQTNATFVFFVYQLSDCLMLVAAALVTSSHAEIAAIALVTAATIKTSQFPFTNLFARAMEGASPSSALGKSGRACMCWCISRAAWETRFRWVGYRYRQSGRF
jgi:hypothetical protein